MRKYAGTICDLLSIEYPVIQGGMAWVSNASLAAAVSMAGGLGVIAAGNAQPEWVAEQIRLVREKTDKPFGLNVMLLSPYVEEVAKLAADEKVPVVITGAGNPSSYVKMWKEAGSLVAPVVASRALANDAAYGRRFLDLRRRRSRRTHRRTHNDGSDTRHRAQC